MTTKKWILADEDVEQDQQDQHEEAYCDLVRVIDDFCVRCKNISRRVQELPLPTGNDI